MRSSEASVLVIFAHPYPRQSRANKAIVSALRELKAVHLQDLYELYPNFLINVAAEKRLLLRHDLIVFQHPLYWYNMPPLLKLWMDEVLEYDFAYGPNGHALRGKKMLVSITCGGDERAYSREGFHGLPVQSFLACYKQTAHLCGMNYLDPLVLYGANKVSDQNIAEHAEQMQRLIQTKIENHL